MITIPAYATRDDSSRDILLDMYNYGNIKIMQLNIWMGHLMDPALAYIKAEATDIVCAQEVLSCERGLGLFGSFQTHQRLCEIFPFHFFAPTFSFQALGEEVTYGNAVYSKYPLTNVQTTFTSGNYAPDQTVRNATGNIRNIQTCEVTFPNGDMLTVANHHGYHDLDHAYEAESTESMRKVVATLRAIKGPLVFCGDLNLDHTYKAFAELDALHLRNLTDESEAETTLSSVHRLGRNLISDYIFVSPDIVVKSFAAPEVIVSDHKPLVLGIEL